MAQRWNLGTFKRLPEHYKKFRNNLNKESTPVHYKPEIVNFKKNPENGQIFRVQNVPIPTMKVPAANQGIWGGEEVIRGFRKPGSYRRVPSYWIPTLHKKVVYSEIFDKYLSVVVTQRTLNLIDECHGFDNYILRTPVQDFKSQLALDLRRKMLLALVRKDFYKDNPEKQEKILQKYADCIIPEEEAEWFGLSLKEACKKQLKIEDELNKPVPLKIQFRQDLIAYLKETQDKLDNGELDKEKPETSLLDKIGSYNIFKKSEAKK